MSTDEFQVGDRVRVQHGGPGVAPGEEGRVLSSQRDEQGSVISVTLLLDSDTQATRGTTVYLRESALEKLSAPIESQGSTEQELERGEDDARALGDQPA